MENLAIEYNKEYIFCNSCLEFENMLPTIVFSGLISMVVITESDALRKIKNIDSPIL
jgi:hypothetical protein